MEAEDEIVMQREYTKLMESREGTARKFQEQWEREEKEKRVVAGGSLEKNMDIDQGTSSAVGSDYPATARGVKRSYTDEVFN